MQHFTIEAYAKDKVIDAEAEADSAHEALAQCFGGNPGEYYESWQATQSDKVYITECNGQYRYFKRLTK